MEYVKNLVSVCVPTYNGEVYLSEALMSIENQTYNLIEIIISDDNSNDNTFNIVENFKKSSKFPVKIIKHIPSGIAENWNNCIKNSDGEFIKFLFQDDLLDSTCIEKMIDILIADSSIGLVSCKRDIISNFEDKSEYVKSWKLNFGNLQSDLSYDANNNILLDSSFIKSKYFLSPPINKIGEPSLYFFKKNLVEEIGYFDNSFKQLLDYEFCCRVLKKYKILILGECLASFRLHKNQATSFNVNKNDETVLFKKYLFKKYFLNLSWKDRKIIFLDYFYLGRFLYFFKNKLLNNGNNKTTI